MQGRELTLANIKQVLGTVAKAASAGAAGSPLPAVDVEGLLGKAFAGMDGALEQAVQANRKALQQMVDQGANLRETQLKKALADIEKMEDTLFDAVRKARGSGRDRPARRCKGRGPRCWMQAQGKTTSTGALASATSSSCWTTRRRPAQTAARWACTRRRPCWTATRRWSAAC